jgi:hypothetical protein
MDDMSFQIEKDSLKSTCYLTQITQVGTYTMLSRLEWPVNYNDSCLVDTQYAINTCPIDNLVT